MLIYCEKVSGMMEGLFDYIYIFFLENEEGFLFFFRGGVDIYRLDRGFILIFCIFYFYSISVNCG